MPLIHRLACRAEFRSTRPLRALRRSHPTFAALFGLLLCAVAACTPTPMPAAPEVNAPVPMIARTALFADPAYASPKVSPNGAMVAYLAPHEGYLNVWVAPIANLAAAKPVTNDIARGIRQFEWAQNSAAVLYAQDDRGDENWRIFLVPAAGGAPLALTPAGVRAELVAAAPGDPEHVLVTLNERDRSWPDVYSIALANGERTRVMLNNRQFSGWVADRAGRLRLAVKTLDNGTEEIWSRSATGRWTVLSEILFEDSQMSHLIGFEADNEHVLMFDSSSADTAALVRMSATTGAKEKIAESPDADIVDVWLNPQTFAPEAYAVEFLRREWRGLTDDARAEITALEAALEGQVEVVSRSTDDQVWTIEESSPTIPVRSWVYDRRRPEAERLGRLFNHRPELAQAPLQPMLPREIQARDGLTLVSYLTLPPDADGDGDGRPETPGPLVLLVHGGPWSRDSYGFDPRHQWLANRGYAVLSVNFRGSTGFGKNFLNAGDLQWGRAMQDDLSDAVAWAVAEGIATPDRVAIMGGSYGGYATLAGLAFTPDLYACGVSLVGPSNLISLLNAIPPYWAAYRTELFARVGDPRTQAGRDLLRERSPLFTTARMRAPLLVGQGARDPRVPRAESDQIVAALAANRANVTYLVYPDEGHGLARPQNRLSWYGAVEGFLGQCVGGRTEPIGTDFTGARVYGVRGTDRVPGLAAVAPPPPAPPPARVAPAEVVSEAVVVTPPAAEQPPKDALITTRPRPN